MCTSPCFTRTTPESVFSSTAVNAVKRNKQTTTTTRSKQIISNNNSSNNNSSNNSKATKKPTNNNSRLGLIPKRKQEALLAKAKVPAVIRQC